MAHILKHIGRMVNNKNTKLLVAFRTLPGESNMALVIPVAKLSDSYHDAIMKVVEEDQAQTSFELGEILFTRTFPDGRPMLQALRADELLRKVPTDQIEMTPTTVDVVGLHQLNVLIAEQKNCAVDDLYTFVSGAPKKSNTTVEDVAQIKDLGRDIGEPNIAPPLLKASANAVLDDKTIAHSYRSQADAMYKEAARLRKEADTLDPPIKKPSKTKETIDA
jgi:hypothetical protein